MDVSNSILVSYGKRNLLFKVPCSLSELKKAAYAKFSLNSSTPIIIQYYNESWCEYIDVTEDKEIVAGYKYRILLQFPEILYVEDSCGRKTQNDFHSSNLLTIDSQVDYSSELSALETNSGYLSELSEPSNSIDSLSDFDIIDPKKFSDCLSKALSEKRPLSRALRLELVNHVCKLITVNTKYPSSLLVTEAARKIVLDYPFLKEKESSGTGFGRWRQNIRDKLKYMRRSKHMLKKYNTENK